MSLVLQGRVTMSGDLADIPILSFSHKAEPGQLWDLLCLGEGGGPPGTWEVEGTGVTPWNLL